MSTSEHREIVYVIDDDLSVSHSLCWLLESMAIESHAFSSAEEFLEAYSPSWQGCILMDVRMPEMSGIQLQKILKSKGCSMPIIIITGHANVTMAITAMKQGAYDFIRKPYNDDVLLKSVQSALAHNAKHLEETAHRNEAISSISDLTTREREVMQLVVEGCQNKVIANQLGISETTVEAHRSRVMHKTGAKSLSELVRIALIADA